MARPITNPNNADKRASYHRTKQSNEIKAAISLIMAEYKKSEDDAIEIFKAMGEDAQNVALTIGMIIDRKTKQLEDME